MAEYLAPGVYVEEFDSGVKAMEGVGTSTAGFVGLAARGPVSGRPVLLTSFADYRRRFGGYLSELEYGGYRYLPNCVEQFFTNGGSTCYVMRVAPENAVAAKSADGPMVVTAMDPGTWANTMLAFVTRTVRSRTQILSIQDSTNGKQYQLKNTAGFRAGDLVAFKENNQITYNQITSVNGQLVTMAEPLSEDAADVSLVPQKTLEACGVDLVILWDDIQESYTGCSLNPSTSDYLGDALVKSTMAKITLNLETKLDDPLVLLGAPPESESLRIELSGGLNGTMDAVNAGTFNGVDNGPGKRTGVGDKECGCSGNLCSGSRPDRHVLSVQPQGGMAERRQGSA